MGFTNINTDNFEVYLTPMAREKLYTGKGGKIEIKYFSLHDGDINYTKSAKTQSFSTTPAGKYTQVPDLRGEPKTIGINGCQIYDLDDFIPWKDMEEDGNCPAGYYKNSKGACVERKYNEELPPEIIIEPSSRKGVDHSKLDKNRDEWWSGRGTPRVVPGGDSY